MINNTAKFSFDLIIIIFISTIFFSFRSFFLYVCFVFWKYLRYNLLLHFVVFVVDRSWCQKPPYPNREYTYIPLYILYIYVYNIFSLYMVLYTIYIETTRNAYCILIAMTHLHYHHHHHHHDHLLCCWVYYFNYNERVLWTLSHLQNVCHSFLWILDFICNEQLISFITCPFPLFIVMLHTYIS